MPDVCCGTAEKRGRTGSQTRTDIRCCTKTPCAIFCEYAGPGYSLPAEQMGEAVPLLARLEGLLRDPVCTGKAARVHVKLGERLRLVPGPVVAGLFGTEKTDNSLPLSMSRCRQMLKYHCIVLTGRLPVTPPGGRISVCAAPDAPEPLPSA